MDFRGVIIWAGVYWLFIANIAPQTAWSAENDKGHATSSPANSASPNQHPTAGTSDDVPQFNVSWFVDKLIGNNSSSTETKKENALSENLRSEMKKSGELDRAAVKKLLEGAKSNELGLVAEGLAKAEDMLQGDTKSELLPKVKATRELLETLQKEKGKTGFLGGLLGSGGSLNSTAPPKPNPTDTSHSAPGQVPTTAQITKTIGEGLANLSAMGANALAGKTQEATTQAGKAIADFFGSSPSEPTSPEKPPETPSEPEKNSAPAKTSPEENKPTAKTATPATSRQSPVKTEEDKSEGDTGHETNSANANATAPSSPTPSASDPFNSEALPNNQATSPQDSTPKEKVGTSSKNLPSPAEVSHDGTNEVSMQKVEPEKFSTVPTVRSLKSDSKKTSPPTEPLATRSDLPIIALPSRSENPTRSASENETRTADQEFWKSIGKSAAPAAQLRNESRSANTATPPSSESTPPAALTSRPIAETKPIAYTELPPPKPIDSVMEVSDSPAILKTEFGNEPKTGYVGTVQQGQMSNATLPEPKLAAESSTISQPTLTSPTVDEIPKISGAEFDNLKAVVEQINQIGNSLSEETSMAESAKAETSPLANAGSPIADFFDKIRRGMRTPQSTPPPPKSQVKAAVNEDAALRALTLLNSI